MKTSESNISIKAENVKSLAHSIYRRKYISESEKRNTALAAQKKK